MAFTDVELGILSYFSFYSFSDSDKPIDFGEYIKKHENSLKLNLGDDYSNSVEQFVTKVSGSGYTLVARKNDNSDTGFAAFAIVDSEDNITVVCRGTEGFINTENGKRDIKSDFQLAYQYQTDQHRMMLGFMQKIKKQRYKSYTFTGHSLGGNLAIYGAMMLGDPELVSTCVTFNAPGYNKTFLEDYSEQIDAVKDKIVNYQNECDAVSNAFTVIGEVVVVECKGVDFLHKDGFSAHYMDMFTIENGKFKRNRTGRKDVTIGGVFIDTLTWVTDNTLSMKDAEISEDKLQIEL